MATNTGIDPAQILREQYKDGSKLSDPYAEALVSRSISAWRRSASGRA